MSRVGKMPITLPDKVSIKIDNRHVTVEGPKGKLEWQMPEGVDLRQQDGSVVIERASDLRSHRALHGTARSIVNNMVHGVHEGFVKNLEIKGVGFRAAIKGSALDLSLGYSHPVLHPIPEDIKVTVNENTKISVEGIDKQRVGQFAAEVRAYYPPEPYKGKGVAYVGEHIRRKEGKSVKK